MAESGQGGLSALSSALASAVERAAAATVAVSARRRMPASGVVYESGVIVTADHTIEREDEISIRTTGATSIPAKLAGRDAGTDLAVLRIDGGGLTAATAGETARVGNIVLALGRSGAGPEVSLGVVSAISGPTRTWRGGQIEGFIRTDATFYPGFSGGPLIDVSGNVLGINTSGLSRGNGVTLSWATVERVVRALLAHGKIKRGFLGISSQAVGLTENQSGGLGGQKSGLLVVGAETDGPAGKAGIIVGDIVVGLAGDAVRDTDDLQRLLSGDVVGKSTPVKVLRGGEPRDVPVVIGERP